MLSYCNNSKATFLDVLENYLLKQGYYAEDILAMCNSKIDYIFNVILKHISVNFLSYFIIILFLSLLIHHYIRSKMFNYLVCLFSMFEYVFLHTCFVTYSELVAF